MSRFNHLTVSKLLLCRFHIIQDLRTKTDPVLVDTYFLVQGDENKGRRECRSVSDGQCGSMTVGLSVCDNLLVV